ncbi:MAG: hypothetical protein ACFCVA_06430 [Gammaproteobacteria bacterium]
MKRFTFDDIEKPEERGDSLRYELWDGKSVAMPREPTHTEGVTTHTEGVTSWSVYLLTAY